MDPVLPDRLDPTPWRERAACRGRDLRLFFPPEQTPEPERRHLEQRALSVCQGCPVRQPCLAYSIFTEQRSGVWGGVAVAGTVPAGPPAAARAVPAGPGSLGSPGSPGDPRGPGSLGGLGGWTCANCQQANPARRRRCWDCGTSRD